MNAFVTDSMPDRKEKYLLTIKKLRAVNFSRDLPFLILSDQLPDGQVYREYPDGHIELQEVFLTGTRFQYKLIHTVADVEADRIRQAYGLL